ncbi:hypothetical protein PIB30_094671, partial [Stylosanthes scabra]|nr:hypothetical protein [Stylosanthes scabra]
MLVAWQPLPSHPHFNHIWTWPSHVQNAVTHTPSQLPYPSSTYTVSPTSHPPLFRASLPSSRLCTNTHLASKPITPSSHVWHSTNVVLAFLSHDRATTSHLLNQLPTLTLHHNPALTFGVAKR